jgi:hypothetical protein
MMSLLTCIPKEIWAALIQALPVLSAAYVGYRSLNTWQKQLREGRQVEHAEKALAAEREMFLAVRAVRSSFSSFSREEAADRTKLDRARERLIVDRLNRGWEAWRRFQDHYALVGFFIDPARPRLDVAKEVAGCISDLQDHAEMMWLLEEDGDDPASRQEAVKERKAFYGYPRETDPLEKRLSQAEKEVQAQLRAILLLAKPWWRRA